MVQILTNIISKFLAVPLQIFSQSRQPRAACDALKASIVRMNWFPIEGTSHIVEQQLIEKYCDRVEIASNYFCPQTLSLNGNRATTTERINHYNMVTHGRLDLSNCRIQRRRRWTVDLQQTTHHIEKTLTFDSYRISIGKFVWM